MAKRRDQRALPPLIAALQESDVTDRVIDAACDMLNMQRDNEAWSTGDYTSALRGRFGL